MYIGFFRVCTTPDIPEPARGSREPVRPARPQVNPLGLPEPAPLSPVAITVNLAICVVLASVLAVVYQRYGRSMTNRALLAGNFVMISLTTTLIISIVKSNIIWEPT